MDHFPHDANGSDQTAFSQIVSTYRPLIESLVSQFRAPGGEDEEDLRQEAMIALYSAYCTYDFRQEQVSFGLYAKVCMRNRLITLMRRKKPKETEMLLQSEDAGIEADDPEQQIIDREGYLGLVRVIDESLTAFEKSVLGLYLEEKSYAQIARALGVTEKAVDNAIYRLKAKLRKRI